MKVIPTGLDDRVALPSMSVELVIDRHAAFDPKEVHRGSRPGGTIVTQQVGGELPGDRTWNSGSESAPLRTQSGGSRLSPQRSPLQA